MGQPAKLGSRTHTVNAPARRSVARVGESMVEHVESAGGTPTGLGLWIAAALSAQAAPERNQRRARATGRIVNPLPRPALPCDRKSRTTWYTRCTPVCVARGTTTSALRGRGISMLLKIGEAAERLSLSPRKVAELVATEAVPCRRIGRALRFVEVELEAWVRSGCPCRPGSGRDFEGVADGVVGTNSSQA